MSRYGYPWPDIVKCDQFPADNDMCISEQHAKGGVGGLGPSPSSSLPVSHYDVYPDGTPMGVTSSPSSSRVPSSTEGSKGKTGSRSKKRKKKRKQHHHHHHPHDRQVNPNNNSDNSQGNKGISSSGENSSSHSQQHHAHHHRDHRIIRIEEQEEHEERSHVPDISQDQDVEPAGRRILPPSSMIDAASPSSSTLSYGSRNSMSTPSPHHVHHHLQNFDQLRHELEEEGTTTTSPVTTYQSILLPRDNGPSSPHQQAGTSSRAGGSVLSSIDSNADDVAATSSSGQHQPGHDHRERQKRVNASGRVSASPSPEPLWIQMRDAYCMSEWSLKGRGRLSLDSRAGHQLSTSSIHEQGKESQTGGRRRKGSARVSMHQVVNRMANMPEFLFIQIQGYKVLHGSFDVGRETAAPLPASKDTPIEITIPNSVMQQFVQLNQPDSNSDHHHSRNQEIAGGRMRRGDGNSSRSRKRTTKRPIEPSDNREPLESGGEEAKSIRFYVMGFTSGSGQHLASFLMPWNSKDKELR